MSDNHATTFQFCLNQRGGMVRQFLCISVILCLIGSIFAIYEEEWTAYKTRYNKKYRRRQESLRKSLFIQTHEMILSHNSKDSLFKMEHNIFSDMTRDEKERYMGLGVPTQTETSAEQSFIIGESLPKSDADEALPSALDYRTDECLLPVRDQGTCGSCWAFTALTPLEFSYCKITGQKVSLSEQHLVDCDFLNLGCSGGWYTRAWVYLYLTGGAVEASEYPYAGEDGVCKSNQTTVAVQVKQIGKAGKNATAIQRSLHSKGPISVAIIAMDSLLHFKSGIYDDQESCDNETLNHAVVLVGYGAENGTDYWIIRNSWGSNWAENGYARVIRGVNLCMMETYGYYAVAAGVNETVEEE